MNCNWQSDLEEQTSVADSLKPYSNPQVLQKASTEPWFYERDTQLSSLAGQYIQPWSLPIQ